MGSASLDAFPSPNDSFYGTVVDHCNYEALKTPNGKRRAEHVQIIPNDKHNLCVLLMAILSGATSI